MSSKPELHAPSTTYSATGDRGVDSGKLSAATQAFADYATDLANTFGGFKTQITGYTNAFYGDENNNVQSYVNGVIDSCQALMAEIGSFEAKVSEAMNNYATQATSTYGAMGNNATSGGNGN